MTAPDVSDALAHAGVGVQAAAAWLAGLPEPVAALAVAATAAGLTVGLLVWFAARTGEPLRPSDRWPARLMRWAGPWLGHLAATAAGFVLAAAMLDAADRHLEARVDAAARFEAGRLTARAAGRWADRAAGRLADLNAGYGRDDGSLPPWAAARRGKPSADATDVARPLVLPAKHPGTAVLAGLLRADPRTRRRLRGELRWYRAASLSADETAGVAALAGPAAAEAWVAAPRAESAGADPLDRRRRLEETFRQPPGALAAALRGPLGKVLLDGDSVDEVGVVFVLDEGKGEVALRPEAVPFVRAGWDGRLADAVAKQYRTPSAADRAADVYRRVGTPYRKPGGRDLARAVEESLARPGPNLPPGAVRAGLAGRAAAELLAPPPRAGEPAVDDAGVPLARLLTTRYAGALQAELVEAVDHASTRDAAGAERAFRMGVSDADLRGMLRGPVQFVTVGVLFTGLLLLAGGLVDGVLWTLAAVRVRGARSGRRQDVWAARPGDAAAAADRATVSGDLVAALFAAGLPEPPDRRASAVDAAARVWYEQRLRQFVILDYLEYLLPALGFIGTLIGNGQGLGLANKVALADSQAEGISEMTLHLGQAFYATLVALSCSILFLLARAVLNRLLFAVATHAAGEVKRHLTSQA